MPSNCFGSVAAILSEVANCNGVSGFSWATANVLVSGCDSLPYLLARLYVWLITSPRMSRFRSYLLAVVSAPSWTREVVENLDVLRSPTMDDVDRARLLARGAAIREESLDFGRHVRRFPVAPEELLDRELAAAAVDPGS